MTTPHSVMEGSDNPWAMGIKERIKLLQDTPFFGAINEQSVELLIDLSETCQLSAGEYFYHQGELGKCLYILVSGQAEILKERNHQRYALCTIEPGGCFGELAMINFTPRSASAQAIKDCEAIRIPATALHELYKQNSEQFLLIQMNMAREVCRRLQEADERWFESKVEIPSG